MITDVVEFALGTFHTMFLMQDGSAWSSGGNPGQPSTRFVKIIPSGATTVAAGNGYSIILKQHRFVWAVGQNTRGQLGDGTTTTKDTIYFLRMISGASAVAAGDYHSMILTQQGRVWVSGWNKYGQLGYGSTSDKTRFFRVFAKGTKIFGVAAGNAHSIVLKQDGSVWAAGRNYHGQLGDGSKMDKSVFTEVVYNGAADVDAGSDHSMVLKDDGSVWATGWNEYGQLGDGTTTDRVNYVQVVSDDAKDIAAGGRHSMVLMEDGSVWATGDNESGQLGDGSTINRKNFVQVMEGANSFAAGALHSIARKRDGSFWATGSNQHGQFGNGMTRSERSFVRFEPFINGARHKHVKMDAILCPQHFVNLPHYIFCL